MWMWGCMTAGHLSNVVNLGSPTTHTNTHIVSDRYQPIIKTHQKLLIFEKPGQVSHGFPCLPPLLVSPPISSSASRANPVMPKLISGNASNKEP